MAYIDNIPKKYRCWCGVMDVVNGTKVICVFTLITCLLTALALPFFMRTQNGFLIEAAELLVTVFAAFATYEGIKRKNTRYFIPFLVLLMVTSVYTGLVALVSYLAMIFGAEEIREVLEDSMFSLDYQRSHLRTLDVQMALMIIGTAYLLATILNLWFFSVVYKCYKYFCDYKNLGYDPMALPQVL